MNTFVQPYYDAASNFLGDLSNDASGKSEITELDDGMKMLDALGADDATKAAWCLFPLVRNDENLMSSLKSDIFTKADPSVVAIVMEARRVNSLYLCRPFTDEYTLTRMFELCPVVVSADDAGVTDETGIEKVAVVMDGKKVGNDYIIQPPSSEYDLIRLFDMAPLVIPQVRHLLKAYKTLERYNYETYMRDTSPRRDAFDNYMEIWSAFIGIHQDTTNGSLGYDDLIVHITKGNGDDD